LAEVVAPDLWVLDLLGTKRIAIRLSSLWLGGHHRCVWLALYAIN
jgi:hypothetical protein